MTDADAEIVVADPADVEVGRRIVGRVTFHLLRPELAGCEVATSEVVSWDPEAGLARTRTMTLYRVVAA